MLFVALSCMTAHVVVRHPATASLRAASSPSVDIRVATAICHVDLPAPRRAASQTDRQPRPPPPSAIRYDAGGAATVAQPSSCMKPINYDAINDATVAAGSINIIDPAPDGRERPRNDGLSLPTAASGYCAVVPRNTFVDTYLP